MPYYENGYLDPIHIVWRKGTPEDPYLDKVEYPMVVNQTVVLQEIPDKIFRVRINGMQEVNYEHFTNFSLSVNEFYVNYSLGVIQFHRDMEARTITVLYKGRGFIQYPSERIYHRDRFNNVVKSLANIIDESNGKLQEAEIKIQEIIKVIAEAEVAVQETNRATDNAIIATEEANVATERALDAYNTTRLVFKSYVEKYEDIAIRYPIPEVGWTTQVYETGIRYRWDGISWVPIEGFGGNIPKATDDYDGLMSKEHFTKVEDISGDVDVRTVVFVVPDTIIGGVQNPHLIFPYDGEILEVIAYVATKGTTDTPVEIEYSNDFETWSKIANKPFIIKAGDYEDDKSAELLVTNVERGTKFRLNVPLGFVDAMNLQVNIKIKIN